MFNTNGPSSFSRVSNHLSPRPRESTEPHQCDNVCTLHARLLVPTCLLIYSLSITQTGKYC